MWKRLMYLALFVVALISLLGSPAVGAFNANTDSSLISWYKLDETSGLTAADSSRSGHDGTVNGGAQWVAGWRDGALQFNGSNAYVDCGNEAGADVTDGVTVAAWINADTFGDWRGIITKGMEASPYAMQTWGGGLLRFSGNWGTVTGGTGTGTWNSAGAMPTGEWVHAAIAVGSEALTFYINVVPEEISIDLEFGTVNEPLILGCDFPGGDEYFDGIIDDVRIYNRTLSEVEVQAVMLGLGSDIASSPIPDDGQVDVPRDVVLSWTAGAFAAMHDVYFATSLDDVTVAGRDNSLGVLARPQPPSIPTACSNSARPTIGVSMRSTRHPTARSSPVTSGASPSSRWPIPSRTSSRRPTPVRYPGSCRPVRLTAPA